MLRTTLSLCLVACVVAALSGCARKQTETASSTSSDSLLATSPVEDQPGDLTPQLAFPDPQAPPHAVPKPRPAAPSAPAPEPAPPTPASTRESPVRTPESPGLLVTWGSSLRVEMSDEIRSDGWHPGEVWSGTLKDSVFAGPDVAFPAGSVVRGTVTEAKASRDGQHARLTLELTSIDAHGKTHVVSATMKPIEAESHTARKVGGILGGTAAGALIGQAIGGKKGALIGGAVGGAAAGGAVAATTGDEVVLKRGSVVRFTMAKDAVVRR